MHTNFSKHWIVLVSRSYKISMSQNGGNELMLEADRVMPLYPLTGSRALMNKCSFQFTDTETKISAYGVMLSFS